MSKAVLTTREYNTTTPDYSRPVTVRPIRGSVLYITRVSVSANMAYKHPRELKPVLDVAHDDFIEAGFHIVDVLTSHDIRTDGFHLKRVDFYMIDKGCIE